MTTEYGGPLRGLELLWGIQKRPRRGPKPGLSLERVVRAGIEIADAEGLAALSMRRVAERLGFTTMALYRYVPGKAELLDLMADTVAGELAPPEDAAAGWRAQLEHFARADWALFHRHPWALQLSVNRPVAGPNGLASYDATLRAVSAIGLTPGEVIAVVHTVYNYVRGTARVSVDAALAEQLTGMSDEQWYAERSDILDRIFASGRYPTMARLGEMGAWVAPAEPAEPPSPAGLLADFEFGLRRLLDGIELFVRERSAARSGVEDEGTAQPTSGARS
jgi:AcrR family transcriptional regulator